MGSVWAPLGSMLVCFCVSVAGSWAPFSSFLEMLRKFVQKEEKKGAEMDVFSMMFRFFSRKWESAFRLRRRERIEVHAPTFLALYFHFSTPFFAPNFIAFWTPLGPPKSEVGGSAGTPLNAF